MENQYDLIVIGAGNGGLMAACRAAHAGLSVLVAERHHLPGGAATSFVRGRFEFEASLHETLGFGSEGDETGKLFSGLGIETDMVPLKDCYRFIVGKNGVRELDITMPHGRDRVMETISRECPGDMDRENRAEKRGPARSGFSGETMKNPGRQTARGVRHAKLRAFRQTE